MERKDRDCYGRQPGFDVVIVGAGAAGIAACRRLAAAKSPTTVRSWRGVSVMISPKSFRHWCC